MKSPNRTPLFSAPLLGLCASLFLAFNAHAGPQDKNPIATVLDRPFNWTGFYIGANIGGVLSDYEFSGSGTDGGALFSDVDIAQQFDTLGLTSEGTPSGIATFFGPSHEERRGSIIGGGQAGYNFQFGHFVVGVEGDFDRTSERGFASFQDTADTTIFSGQEEIITATSSFVGTRKAESNWNASARLRVGYAHGPVLIYGTGGVAFADVRVWANDRVSTDFFVEPFFGGGRPAVQLPDGFPQVQQPQQGRTFFAGRVTNTNISRSDDTFVGWTAGGGIEVAFGEATTFALEYRHNGFGNETFSFNSHGGPIFSGNTHVDLDSDQVTIRMNILLNHMFGGGDGFSTGLVQGSAKDKNVAVAPMVEEFSWSGPYIGANVGGVWTDYDFGGFGTDVSPSRFAQIFGTGSSHLSTPSIDGGSDDSILGGGQAGYQWQFGHFVAGVEADFAGMSSTSSSGFSSTEVTKTPIPNTPIIIDDVTTVVTTRSVDEKWQASARARLGWTKGRILLYATGGGAWAGVTSRMSSRLSTDTFFEGIIPTIPIFVLNTTAKSDVQNDEVVGGWTAGAGAEWAFNNVFSVGMEYRHNEFSDADLGRHQHDGIFTEGSHVSLDSDQVTFKVNVLLGTLFRRQ